MDGCQWHGCPEHYVRPRTRSEFWGSKLKGNVLRDSRQTLALEAEGWRVVRIWEHALKRAPAEVVARVLTIMEGKRERRLPDWRVFVVDVIDPARDLERRHLMELRAPNEMRIEERKRTTAKA